MTIQEAIDRLAEIEKGLLQEIREVRENRARLTRLAAFLEEEHRPGTSPAETPWWAETPGDGVPPEEIMDTPGRGARGRAWGRAWGAGLTPAVLWLRDRLDGAWLREGLGRLMFRPARPDSPDHGPDQADGGESHRLDTVISALGPLCVMENLGVDEDRLVRLAMGLEELDATQREGLDRLWRLYQGCTREFLCPEHDPGRRR